MEAAAEPRELPSGTMLDDKYRVDDLIAVGGMGAVYSATHTKLRKRVAIKLLNPQLATPQMIERFHREAITASQIGHEGIAQVTDLGTSLHGETFLVMEYLEGDSLARRLKKTGALPIDVACEMTCAILSPLEAAHRAGIVHRDLKPDNVFLVRQSRGEMVKLLDFGISRVQGLEGEFRLTTTGLVLGTPYYMSPEQARGESMVTYAADLYSIGVVLYEMLCGQVPITAENYNQLMYKVMLGDYVPPRKIRKDIPVQLEQLIMKTMAIDPAHRPASAAELEKALLAFCRPTFREHTIERISSPGLSGSLTPATPVPRTARTLATGPAPTIGQHRKRTGLVIGLVILVVGIGIAAFIATRSGDEPTNVATPTPTPTPAPSPPPPPPPPVAPATISLRFAITPASATIELDGKPIADNPYTAPKDDAVHKLHITAPGYLPHDEDVKFDEAQRLSITLDRPQAPKVPAKTPQKAHPTQKPDKIESQSPYEQ